LLNLIDMDVSIVIVNFNTDKLVSDCIASIKRNTKKITYETIVIDNSINNRGFAKANNLGIKKAKGKYILLLNSDTIVGKNSIDKLFEFAKNNLDAGAVVPRLYNRNGSIQASCFRLPTISRAFNQYFWKDGKLLDKRSLSILDKYFPRSENPSIVESAVMAAFLITPEALKKVGKLNEKYFMYFDDIDYCKRISEIILAVKQVVQKF